MTNRPPIRLIVAATRSTPASRSTRSHDNASASPLRIPADAINTSAGWSRDVSAARRTAVTASASKWCLVDALSSTTRPMTRPSWATMGPPLLPGRAIAQYRNVFSRYYDAPSRGQSS
jgi:hypothetical protein